MCTRSSAQKGVRLNKNAYSTIDFYARRNAQMGVNMSENIAVENNTVPVQPAPYLVEKKQDTVYTKKMKEGFGVFGIASAIYAIFYTFCMYKNSSGITFPFFVVGSLLFLYFCLSKLEISLKKGSVFYIVSMVLLGISTFCTDDWRIIYLNKTAIFVLMISMLLNQMYQTNQWKLGKYLASICLTVIYSLEEVVRPFVDFSAYIDKIRKNKNSKTIYIVIGSLIAIPMFIIVLALLSSADAVFRELVNNILGGLNIFNLIHIVVMTVFMFFASYCLLSNLCKKELSEEVKDKKKWEPVLAITITSLLSVLYLVFSGIQIIYLFIGQMQLPEGYTYAKYAREGFFQLLVVCIINLIIVLFTLTRFKENNILKGILTVMSICTFVMIASSALRMLLYIETYYLTFLRIFVLWALVVLFILFVGVVISIYKDRFPLFHYSMVVVTIFYLVLSFSHPDYYIAKINLSNTKYSKVEAVGNEEEDEYYKDYYYIEGLSLDAAPAVLEFYKEYGANIQNLGFEDSYIKKVKNQTKNNDRRHFNISRYIAGNKLKNY